MERDATERRDTSSDTSEQTLDEDFLDLASLFLDDNPDGGLRYLYDGGGNIVASAHIEDISGDPHLAEMFAVGDFRGGPLFDDRYAVNFPDTLQTAQHQPKHQHSNARNTQPQNGRPPF